MLDPLTASARIATNMRYSMMLVRLVRLAIYTKTAIAIKLHTIAVTRLPAKRWRWLMAQQWYTPLAFNQHLGLRQASSLP